MVPIENSVEGGVSATPRPYPQPAGVMCIIREVLSTDRFVLVAARSPSSIEDVKTISTHSHAMGRRCVLGWARRTHPPPPTCPASSTAAAAVGLLEEG